MPGRSRDRIRCPRRRFEPRSGRGCCASSPGTSEKALRAGCPRSVSAASTAPARAGRRAPEQRERAGDDAERRDRRLTDQRRKPGQRGPDHREGRENGSSRSGSTSAPAARPSTTASAKASGASIGTGRGRDRRRPPSRCRRRLPPRARRRTVPAGTRRSASRQGTMLREANHDHGGEGEDGAEQRAGRRAAAPRRQRARTDPATLSPSR